MITKKSQRLIRKLRKKAIDAMMKHDTETACVFLSGLYNVTRKALYKSDRVLLDQIRQGSRN